MQARDVSAQNGVTVAQSGVCSDYAVVISSNGDYGSAIIRVGLESPAVPGRGLW